MKSSEYHKNGTIGLVLSYGKGNRKVFYPIIVIMIFLGASSCFHSPICDIRSRIEHAIINNDPSLVHKYSLKYETYELKQFSSKKNNSFSQSNNTFEILKFPYYRMLACEINGDYINALNYLNFYSDTNLIQNASENECFFLCEKKYPARVLWFHEARIKYKMGNKKDSFIIYCSNLSNVSNPFSNIKTLQNIRSEIMLSNHPAEKKLNCFNDYSEFLKFIDEEFANLGSPNKYSEVVELFHALADEPL